MNEELLVSKIKAEGAALYKEVKDAGMELEVNPLTGNRTAWTYIAQAINGILVPNPLEKRNWSELERLVYSAECVKRFYDAWCPSKWPSYRKNKDLTKRVCNWIKEVSYITMDDSHYSEGEMR